MNNHYHHGILGVLCLRLQHLFLICCVLCIGITSIDCQPLKYKIFDMRHGLSQMKVSSLFEDSRGYIWVGTRNGLNRFNGETFVQLTTEDGLLNNRILAISENERNELVILTSAGICVYDGQSFTNYPRNFPNVEYQILKDNHDHFYISSSDIYSFHPAQGYQLLHNSPSLVGSEKSTGHVLIFHADTIYSYARGEKASVRENKHAIKWGTTFATIDHHMLSITPGKSDTTYRYLPEINKWQLSNVVGHRKGPSLLADYCFIDSLYIQSKTGYDAFHIPLNHPNSVIKSANGNYFIGTDNGLIQFYPAPFFSMSSDQLPYAWSIIDNDTHLFFGNYGAGLIQLDKTTKQIQPVSDQYPLFHCGSSMDHQGNMYFSNNAGVVKWDGVDLTIFDMAFPVMYIKFDPIRNHFALGIQQGIALMDRFGRLTMKNHKGFFHRNNYIQNITIGPENKYWCGSYFGLTVFDPDANTTEHFIDSLNNLPIGPGVFCGYKDANDRLWLGGSNGLCYFDEKENRLHKVKASDLDVQIKSIIELSQGTLLLGGKDELMIFKSDVYLSNQSVVLDFYNQSNGYDGIEPGYTGFYKDLEQNVWITSASNTSYLKHPYTLKKNAPIRPIILSVNNQALSYDREIDTVNLNSKNNIIVDIEAVGTERPHQVRYAFRLNKKAWSPWQITDQIILHNLNHGQHLLEIKAGPFEQSNSLVAAAYLSVHIPIYQRAFFLPMILLLLMLTIAAAAYGWWRRRQERRRYLIQLEESRYLRSQLLLSELNPHFIFNVLASIQNKILKGEKEQANIKLVQLSKLIRSFLNVSFKSNDPKNRLEHEITLHREIELLSSYLQFEQSNSNNHFDYTVDIGPNCEPTQIMIPPMLIQPFVENAVKHGVLPKKDKGHVNISFTYSENALICVILDDGLGIEKMKKRMERKLARKGLGSRIVKERIDVLNNIGYHIEFNAQQRNEGGTRVELIIHE